jgi:predicted RNA binding protein YcfA (HicA-like mRNA interferase family)
MTEREILKLLKNADWEITEGKKHHKALKDNKMIPIPKHPGDIPTGTVNKILKLAGLK